MAAQSIEQFAASIRVPVDRLLRQLQEAGVGVRTAGDSITDDEKAALLECLAKAHQENPEKIIAELRKMIE